MASSQNNSDGSQSSSPSSPATPNLGPLFPQFSSLPPELRHHIWRAALPAPGINFFNVHCFPNDHLGANRSTSPNYIYLDLRRLDIEDTDEEVAEYDPSAWLARSILRSVCREARVVCEIPPEECAEIVLTRPQRGLYIRAADGQLRALTPLHPPGRWEDEPPGPGIEPLEHRTVQTHVRDILCLSVENCSFNLPFEERPEFHDTVDSTVGIQIDDETDGWSYDPQLEPPLPGCITRENICIGVTRGDWATLEPTYELLGDIVSFSRQRDRETRLGPVAGLPLLMADVHVQEVGGRGLAEITPIEEVFWDRFGDAYIKLPWERIDQPIVFRVTKVWPERNDVRKRYMRSAILRSPKRPIGSR
ncbi:hypothetical protein F5Y04DRAFT_286046 [Hypomontagnella monticulosa]|nr:hypothetical protein F5Y04DRAFT_286046 [Hypomontagnella monticulosa]